MKKLLKIEALGNNGAKLHLAYINRLPAKMPNSQEFCFIFEIERRSRAADIEKNKEISVAIESLDHWAGKKNYSLLNCFDLQILEWHNLSKKIAFVRGNVTESDFAAPYCQEIYGVLNMWQKGQEIDWFALDYRSAWKIGYLHACLRFSAISESPNKKEAYYFDFSLIWEEEDLYYLAAEAFFGKRGYMGYNFHTFKDCFWVLHQAGISFEGATVHFLNISRLQNYLTDFYRQVKEVFEKFKFTIEEKA